MPKIAQITGALLIATGVGGFAAAGFEASAITALIPAVFGVLIAICGILAERLPLRRRALKAATVLGLLGFLLPASRLGMVIAKGEFAWTLATAMLTLATGICLVFSVLCLSARRSAV